MDARPLGHVSRDALLTAAAIAPGGDSEATAGYLYHANWLPVTPAWLARFPDEDAVTRYVVGERAARVLDSRWLRSQDASWNHWRAVRRGRLAGPYKVYVSVLPGALPAAFERCVHVLADHRAHSFKLARHPRGLPRPDRFVIYCATREEARELAAALAGALAGQPAQGVPFTHAPRHPAVSWACDPPPDAAGYGPSWRKWVTRKLAAHLHASDAPDAGGRAEYACLRLREDGVDTGTWSPGPGLWSLG
ncbi:hypothetical protein ACIBIZ_35825 [Nonomuraea spiralis]|uniref:hypothetical protein n=1 Tax=Nonomuraea spiralis TaxID=46182 RepID=UPI0037BE1ACE